MKSRFDILDIKLDKIIEQLEDMVNIMKNNSKIFDETEEVYRMIPKFYEIEDLEKILKLTKHTIRTFIHEGKLKAHRIGKNFRVYEDDLNDFINNSKYENQINIENLKDS